MARAVGLESPVTIFTWTPPLRKLAIASGTPGRGGSAMAISPRKVSCFILGPEATASTAQDNHRRQQRFYEGREKKGKFACSINECCTSFRISNTCKKHPCIEGIRYKGNADASCKITRESLNITRESLNITRESLNITRESLNITLLATRASARPPYLYGDSLILNTLFVVHAPRNPCEASCSSILRKRWRSATSMGSTLADGLHTW